MRQAIRTGLVSILIFVACANVRAETDFAAFWNKFRSAIVARDKTAAAEMTQFPLLIPGSKIENREKFLRRYDEIFEGEADASQCFATAKPQRESSQRYEIYCPFKATPNDRENAPIRFIFERTKRGWKFAGLDNVNE